MEYFVFFFYCKVALKAHKKCTVYVFIEDGNCVWYKIPLYLYIISHWGVIRPDSKFTKTK